MAYPTSSYIDPLSTTNAYSKPKRRKLRSLDKLEQNITVRETGTRYAKIPKLRAGRFEMDVQKDFPSIIPDSVSPFHTQYEGTLRWRCLFYATNKNAAERQTIAMFRRELYRNANKLVDELQDAIDSNESHRIYIAMRNLREGVC